MGREVKRVALDFDWPLGEVWGGYLMPEELHLPECPDCRYDGVHSSGWSLDAHHINSTFYAHQIGGPRGEELAWNNKITQAEVEMLIENHRLSTFGPFYDRHELPEPDENGSRLTLTRNNRPAPTAEQVNKAQTDHFVHDCINRMLLVEHRCKQLNVPSNCPTCNGKGEVGTPEQRAKYDAWEETEPPEGEGWQLWETTSEGSPTSPIFETADELAMWMSKNPCGFARSTPTLEAAQAFVKAGWAPSMIADHNGLQDGVQACAPKTDDSGNSPEIAAAEPTGRLTIEEERTFDCERCETTVTRQKKFAKTIVPPTTWDEVMAELEAQSEAWKPRPICVRCMTKEELRKEL